MTVNLRNIPKDVSDTVIESFNEFMSKIHKMDEVDRATAVAYMLIVVAGEARGTVGLGSNESVRIVTAELTRTF